MWVLNSVTQEANRSVEVDFGERDDGSMERKASRTFLHEGEVLCALHNTPVPYPAL